MSSRSKTIEKLADPEYRKAFVASQIDIGIPFQIRALQKQRGLTQEELAERAGMAQPRISAVQKPGKGNLNLSTLQRLAAAFDCALLVTFAPFTEIVNRSEQFNPDTFIVPSYTEERAEGLIHPTTRAGVVAKESGHPANPRTPVNDSEGRPRVARRARRQLQSQNVTPTNPNT